MRRYKKEDAHEIIRRASELEARPTAEPELSLGDIESLAGEASIPAEYVRAAAQGLERSPPPLERGGLLGVKPELVLERNVEGEVTPDQYPAMLEEIRVALSEPGALDETLGAAMAWHSTERSGGRQAHVLVSPSEGHTRIRIHDADAPPGSAIVMVPIGVISAVALGITGAIVSGATGSDLLATIVGGGVSLGFFGAAYAWARRSFQKKMVKRAAQLAALRDQLADLVGAADRDTRLPKSSLDSRDNDS